MPDTRLREAAVAVGFLILNVACDASSGANGGVVTVPKIVIESAWNCSGTAKCEEVNEPENVWLETGHSHDVSVRTPPNGTIQSTLSDPTVIEFDSDISSITPTRAKITVRGKSLGEASLDVNLAGSSSDRATLNIRTVTPRVTVVAWVDGGAIIPESIAPGAGENVRRQFKNIENAPGDVDAMIRCMSAMGELLFATISPGTPFVFMDERSLAEDALFTQAALVKSSANKRPPSRLTEKYLHGRDYRLLNDFRVVGGLNRAFVQAPKQIAEVGNTPLPCGGEKVIRQFVDADTLPDWAELGKGEEHTMNGRRVCRWRKDEVTQVSEGRIGRKGREIQRLLSDSTRGPNEITPFIWAGVNFYRNGSFSVDTQSFPTYSVFIDGELDDSRTSKQSSFKEFVAKDATSQYLVAGTDFDRGKCP
jgi:hypothetical protein